MASILHNTNINRYSEAIDDESLCEADIDAIELLRLESLKGVTG